MAERFWVCQQHGGFRDFVSFDLYVLIMMKGEKRLMEMGSFGWVNVFIEFEG